MGSDSGSAASSGVTVLLPFLQRGLEAVVITGLLQLVERLGAALISDP